MEGELLDGRHVGNSAATGLLELLKSPACLLDEAGRVRHLNAAWRDYAGIGAASEPCPGGAQMVCAEDRAGFLSEFESATSSGGHRNFPSRLLDARGASRWFHLSLHPVDRPPGLAPHWLCIATDVDERKRREAALEDRVRMQGDMLDVSVDCIKLIAADGTLLHVNKAGCRALGLPEDSEFGMQWLPLLPADVRAAGEEALARAREGQFARFPGRSELAGQRAQHWDNMLTPVQGGDGRPAAILCVSREVTAEREALASLQDSRERLAVAARAGGFGIWDYDLRADELHCDAAWYRIMGRDPARPIRSIAEFRPCIHPEDVERATEVTRTAEELIAGKLDYAIEFRIVRADGEFRWVRSTACLMQDATGTAVRAVGFVVDIHEAKLAEQAIRDSHQALREAEKLAQTGSWTWDIAADHARWSDTLYEMFGLDPSGPAPRLRELRGIFTPASFATFLAVADQCVSAGIPYSVDLEGVRADGTRFFFNAKGEPMRDPAGRIVKVRGTLADITERKNAENHIRALNERIQLAVEAGGVGIWEMDEATQTFLWDEKMHALYGLAPGEFGGSLGEWTGRLHPQDAPKVLADWAQALRRDATFSAEFRIVHPSGCIRFLRTMARIFDSADGSPRRAIGTSWDITAAKEAEERLRTERHLLRTLVDHLPEVVFITDREDRIQLTNPALRTALEMPPEHELAGRKLHDFLPPPVRDRLWRETLEVMESGQPRLNVIEQVVLNNGTEEWVRTSKIPRRDAQGRVIGVLCFSTNVTQEYSAKKKIQEQATLLAGANAELQSALSEAERQAQRAQASERAKADFLAVMSHEIRTPLNSVLGMVRLALQTPLSAKQRNYLGKIDLSAKSLAAIINDILDFSKIEAGAMTIESVEFPVDSLLDSVSAVCAARAEEKGLELVFDVAEGVPERIVGDPLRLGQILLNLVNNAIKFTERGEVVVSIRAQAAQPGGPAALRFAVRDTGIGLDPEQVKLLFRPFSQADADVSRRFGGTGLGLTICKRLADLMGGSIAVESTPGAGSTFSFTVPARPASAAGQGRPGLPGRRVLVVDDSATTRDVLVRMIRRLGFQVEAAASGLECIGVLQRAGELDAAFDLVLMDWRMPELDGLECARRIKADTQLAQPPAVLLVTTYANDATLQQVEQLGLEGIVTKPVTEAVLHGTILDVLGLAPATASPGLEKATDPAQLRGLRVLLADDSALNRELLSEFLRQLGMQVEVADSGSAALARLREREDFDYLLLDIEMGGLNGFDTARIIRQDPRFGKLPILALTGHVDAEARAAVRAAGMDSHVAKPIDLDVLERELLRLQPAVPGAAMLAGRRVLVVDDNAINREVAGDLLAAVGMETDFATNGREAVERLSRDDFDLVLMDLQMPVMDGLQATRSIRSLPSLAGLPIIALTAQTQDADRRATLAAGMDAHLTKPIDDVQLYRTVRTCLAAAPRRSRTARPAAAVGRADPGGVDVELAAAYLGHDQNLLRKFLRAFVRDYQGAGDRLERLLASRDQAALALFSHTLRSTALYLGATTLADAAARVEEAGEPPDMDDLRARVSVMKEQIRAVREELIARFPDTVA